MSIILKYIFVIVIAINAMMGCKGSSDNIVYVYQSRRWEYNPDFEIIIYRGGALSIVHKEVIIKGNGDCYIIDYESRNRKDYEVTKKSLHLDPNQVEGVIRTIIETDFSQLKIFYNGEPCEPIIGRRNRNGEWKKSIEYRIYDGWSIKMDVRIGLNNKQVRLANGSLNAFHVILRSIGGINKQLSEITNEPLSLMEGAMRSYIEGRGSIDK